MYTVGIDLGGTNIAAGICDSDLNLIIKGSVPTMASREPELIVKDMAALVDSLLQKAGISYSEIAYAGIAAPGSVNPETGVVEYSNNIQMSNFPICDIFKTYSKIQKVYIANDANAAALGEALAGAAKGADVSVMITLGTGVGGGVVIGGKIFAGGVNFSGTELGHTVLVSGGRQCTCGRRGCWEAYSSATGLIKMTREKMLECPDSIMWEMSEGKIENAGGRTAFDAMRKGDKAGKEVVDMYIGYLGAGIVNMINIFQPEVLVIGGGVCNEKEYLTKPLQEIIDREQYSRNNPEELKTKLRIAELGNDAGIIGAAMLGV